MFDRDKVAALGSEHAAGRRRSRRDARRQLRQPLQHRGRSYKVIPQVKRSGAAEPRASSNDIYVTGPEDSSCRSARSRRIKNAVEPRALKRFQQLNAVKISGRGDRVRSTRRLKFLENEAHKILPKGYTLDYTGESRQLRTEGNKFLPAFLLALILIFLVLAAQFNSFRDPFIILARLGPAGAVRRAHLHVPQNAAIRMLSFFTNGWTTTLNIYSQVGLVTLVGLDLEERNPDRRVRQQAAGDRASIKSTP